MKRLQFITTIILLSLFTNIYGQKSQKEIDKKNNKVELFSDEENANLQLYFYDKTQEMNLSEKVEEEYYRILLHYTFDMQRLDDKDKDFTKEETKIELDKLVEKMNSKIQPVLTEQQYKMHLSNFNDILKSVYKRNDWEWNKE